MKIKKEMEMNKENIYLFSKHYKACENEETKKLARSFVEGEAISYDEEEKVYTVICAFAQYKIKWDKKFVCNCGFDNCAHVLALYMQLKIWNYNKKKNINICISTI